MSIDTPAQPTTKVALDAIVSRDDLQRALAFVSVGVATRPPVPILAGVRLLAHGDWVTVMTSDYEVHAWESIAAPGATGSVLLQHAALLKIVKNLPKDALTVTIKVDDNRAVISDGRTIFKVPTMPEEDYPTPPGRAMFKVFQMPGAEFHAAISRVAPAASRDDTLPTLMQVCFRPDNHGTFLYATDRYRLASYQVVDQSADKARDQLVPAKILATVAGHLKTSTMVTVHTDNHRRVGGFYTSISDGRRGVTVLEHESDFPNIERLFPDTTNTTVDLNSEDLLKALKQVDVALVRGIPVRLDMAGDPILVKAGTGDDLQAERPLTVAPVHHTSGSEVESVAFNPGFLIDAIKACGGSTTRMALTHSFKPVTFTDPDVPNFRHLLVPIRFAQ